MSECIIMILQGGIGNQLFQYCAGLSLASSLGGELWLSPIEENKHSGRDYRKTLYNRGKAIGLDESPECKIPFYVQQSNAFGEWNTKDYANKPAIMLKGYFQYLPGIQAQISMVRDDLLTKLNYNRIFLRNKYKIQNPRQTCFLHVRRGDYLKLDTALFWVHDERYFLPAVQAIHQRTAGPRRWFVLSDDITWCRAQSWLNIPPFEIVDEKDEIDGLMLMSLCEGGAVISNSTYSWWGAMLGCGISEVPVAYPAKWIGTSKPNLFPSSWISI